MPRAPAGLSLVDYKNQQLPEQIRLAQETGNKPDIKKANPRVLSNAHDSSVPALAEGNCTMSVGTFTARALHIPG